MTGLVRYDAMCKAIVACHSIDETQEIRAKARALEVYAKQALNTEAERKCGEIRLRAERRAGEILREMKANGTRAKQGHVAPTEGRGSRPSVSGPSVSDAKTLSDIGLTKDQSSKWQQLAEIPEDEFEAEVSKPGPKPTTSGLLSQRKEPEWSIDSRALCAWGRIREFREQGLFALDQSDLFNVAAVPDRAGTAFLTVDQAHEFIMSGTVTTPYVVGRAGRSVGEGGRNSWR